MKDISEITIKLNEQDEKISLFQPLSRKKRIEKWKNKETPLYLFTWIQLLTHKHFKFLLPQKKKNEEAKFKTVLASLLVQSKIRSYLLDNKERREQFLNCIDESAIKDLESNEIARRLTTLEDGTCLFDNTKQLYLQKMLLSKEETNQLLHEILTQIDRKPLLSTIEIVHSKGVEKINLMTKYKKVKISEIDPEGKIDYKSSEDQVTSAIRTEQNILPGKKGVVGQRVAYDLTSQSKIGSYSGALSSKFHVLEQILLLFENEDDQIHLVESHPSMKEKKILFTSLYSWNELGLISKQRNAIGSLNGKALKAGDEAYRLDLLHYNIPFSGWNRLPMPSESGAVMNDYNEETLIWLTYKTFKKIGLPTSDLEAVIAMLKELPKEYLKRQQKILHAVDTFRTLKNWIISSLMQVIGQVDLVSTLTALLLKKRADGKKLKGIDELLYLDHLSTLLAIEHNKNCHNATHRSSGAKAADKAQRVFSHIQGAPFLPGVTDKLDASLFESLYTIYLLWEEPEINALLQTGSCKKYHHFLNKNPETSRYLKAQF
ncbi:MAG: hypothetical protein S4CHLAM45_14640 [Chlamydiales bacterium]|nr:hypothetical protein [Chlamydiales bacterium]MCH9620574.1 hypothetical protein [Chlamydiales bacterium]MCH9623554.1 hypothetical protein [Chlamydiales bacterium]